MPLERGLIQVYTGNGKGKTTAALGVALRAAGQGLRVYIAQFMKGGPEYGEVVALRQLANVTLERFGRGTFVSAAQPDPEDRRLAQEAVAAATAALAQHGYDVVILDEINIALHWGLVSLEQVLALLDAKPPRVELILTGRDAHPAVIERADLVTEMCLVKHPYDRGVGARRGIEY